MVVTQDMDVDSGSLTPNPLTIPISTARNHAQQSGLVNITVAGTTRTLILPMDESFMRVFSNGLSDHHFRVWIDENGRSIRPDRCYSHYLENPSSRLHAEFREYESSAYDSTSSQMGAGSKRRRVNEDKHRAGQWLQEQLVRLSDLANGDEGEF